MEPLSIEEYTDVTFIRQCYLCVMLSVIDSESNRLIYCLCFSDDIFALF